MTVNRSLDLAKARARVGELEESSVPVEVHSELHKNFEDSQARVRELELALVTEESKVSNSEESLRRLREESDEKLGLARESEDQLKSELGQARAKAKAESKAKAAAESRAEIAEAKVAASEKELEEIAMDAVYLVWSHNRSVDLSFLNDPSVQARFETRLAAEASAAAQARQAISEGRVPEADPVVEMEAEVPPEASNIPPV